jgi:hypothetical protein
MGTALWQEIMPKASDRIDLVEATPDRYVLDTPLGRVIVEPRSIRFHRNGRGRGISILADSERAAGRRNPA